MKFVKNVFVVSALLITTGPALADEASKALADNAITICSAFYDKFAKENVKAKKFATGDKNLIVNSCVLRLHTASSTCSTEFIAKLTAGVKDKADKKAAMDVVAKVEKPIYESCLTKANSRAAEDIKLLGQLTLDGQNDKLKSTIGDWQKDGSMKTPQ